MARLNRWTTVIAAGLLVPGLAAAEPAPTSVAPFAPGEQLGYELKLLGIKAGEADIEVQADALEPDTLRFVARGRSMGAADSVFRLRQTAECVVERDTLALKVCRVATRQRTGDRRREFLVDRAGKRIRERMLQGGKPKEKVVEFGDAIDRVQEALSGLYLLRAQLPENGTTLSFQAVRKDKPITVEVTTGAVSKIETPAGTFEAVEVKLRVVKGEADEGETAGSLWFTTDARRLPVKLAVDAKVGTLEALLTRTRGTLAVAPAPARDSLQAKAGKGAADERR